MCVVFTTGQLIMVATVTRIKNSGATTGGSGGSRLRALARRGRLATKKFLTPHRLTMQSINPIDVQYFHYADIALSLVMGYRLCYTHAVEVQPYLVHRPAKCPLLQSTVVF